MPLPKVSTPVFELDLISTNKKVKFRPFLVKEEKSLLIALESGEEKTIINTLKSVLKSCLITRGIKIEDLPSFDLEYLFLNIRGKSVGESVEINLICPDDNKTQVATKINLEDIQVQMTVGHTNVINITDTIKLYLRHPVFSDATSIGTIDGSEGIFKLLNKCIIKITYDDTEYQRIDISDKDIEEFIDQLNTEQFESIIEFFNSMPKLRHVVDVTNPKTNVQSEVVLEGLQSFLG